MDTSESNWKWGLDLRNLEQICRFVKDKRVDEITKKEDVGWRESKPEYWVNFSILGTHRERKIGEEHWKREEGGRGVPEESDSLENKNNNSGRGYSMSKILQGQGKKRAKCSLH